MKGTSGSSYTYFLQTVDIDGDDADELVWSWNGTLGEDGEPRDFPVHAYLDALPASSGLQTEGWEEPTPPPTWPASWTEWTYTSRVSAARDGEPARMATSEKDDYFACSQNLVQVWELGDDAWGPDPVARFEHTQPQTCAGRTAVVDQDIDGDGVDDMLVDVWYENGDEALYFQGPVEGELTEGEADTVMHSLRGNVFLQDTELADMSGDGYVDPVLYIADSSEGIVLDFFSGAEVASSADVGSPFSRVQVSNNATDNIDLGGDFDGDGFADMLFSEDQFINSDLGHGWTLLFFGPLEGSLSTGTDGDARYYNASYVYGETSLRAGGALAHMDVDGDGFDDMFLDDAYGPRIHLIRGGFR